MRASFTHLSITIAFEHCAFKLDNSDEDDNDDSGDVNDDNDMHAEGKRERKSGRERAIPTSYENGTK